MSFGITPIFTIISENSHKLHVALDKMDGCTELMCYPQRKTVLKLSESCYYFKINGFGIKSALLKEACDVFFGAGRPSEGRAVIHQLSGHDERVPPFQLTVIALAIMMNSKAAFKHNQLDQL